MLVCACYLDDSIFYLNRIFKDSETNQQYTLYSFLVTDCNRKSNCSFEIKMFPTVVTTTFTLFLWIGFFFSESSSSTTFIGNTTSLITAQSINSVSFLKELISLKDTIDENFFEEQVDASPTSTDHTCITSIVEYTGRLWFLRKTPIRFQEHIIFSGSSKCGRESSIQCISKYKTNSKSPWIDCSRVNCSFREVEDGEGSIKLALDVTSDVLIKIPLFGMRKKIASHISNTFEKAAHSFLEKRKSP